MPHAKLQTKTLVFKLAVFRLKNFSIHHAAVLDSKLGFLFQNQIFNLILTSFLFSKTHNFAFSYLLNFFLSFSAVQISTMESNKENIPDITYQVSIRDSRNRNFGKIIHCIEKNFVLVKNFFKTFLFFTEVLAS